MHKRIRQLLVLVLVAVFIGLLVNVISSRLSNAATDEKIKETNEQIRLANLKNGELADILSEPNKDDYYRGLAEDNLGYGAPNEKVYKSVPGN